MQQQQYIRRVFSHQQYQGNVAAVVLYDDGPGHCDAELLKIAISNRLPATAFVYPTATVNLTPCYFIRWFSCQGEISLCGHGALAAADVILSGQHHAKNKLYFRYGQGLLSVERNDNNQYVLAFDCVELMSLPLPSAIASIINQGVISCQQTSASDGYLILRLADQAALGNFDFDQQIYSVITDRALIVTVADAIDNSILYFRYFAPQYGVKEDSATGSAAPVLAAFWQLASGSSYQCIQLSPTGGFYRIKMAAGKVHLIGEVE